MSIQIRDTVYIFHILIISQRNKKWVTSVFPWLESWSPNNEILHMCIFEMQYCNCYTTIINNWYNINPSNIRQLNISTKDVKWIQLSCEWYMIVSYRLLGIKMLNIIKHVQNIFFWFLSQPLILFQRHLRVHKAENTGIGYSFWLHQVK